MCTAATYKTKDFYFGRTLDYEFSYGDEVTVTPRNYPFHFRYLGDWETHYAMIGIAHVAEDYPLYYDAVNEKGLGMAGLNFVGNADYKEKADDKDNVAQFEFIPWILGQCATVREAKELLEKINLVNTPFSEKLPLAQLHWLIADSTEAITVESVKDGIKVYHNPAGVLTNNPPFEEQMFHIIRAFHVAGRCTDCGECSRVCPQGIPLHLFNRKFIKDIDQFYGEYQAGEDTDSKGPLTNYTFDDVEPSIVGERG